MRGIGWKMRSHVGLQELGGRYPGLVGECANTYNGTVGGGSIDMWDRCLGGWSSRELRFYHAEDSGDVLIDAYAEKKTEASLNI